MEVYLGHFSLTPVSIIVVFNQCHPSLSSCPLSTVDKSELFSHGWLFEHELIFWQCGGTLQWKYCKSWHYLWCRASFIVWMNRFLSQYFWLFSRLPLFPSFCFANQWISDAAGPRLKCCLKNPILFHINHNQFLFLVVSIILFPQPSGIKLN